MDLSRSRLLLFLVSVLALGYNHFPNYATQPLSIPPDVQAKCAAIKSTPGPSASFFKREVSDRLEVGTNSTLITNATLLIGQGNDTQALHGDLYLDKGLIKGIGSLAHLKLENTLNLTVVNANGAWVTPGLVDIHTHLGLLAAPFLNGQFEYQGVRVALKYPGNHDVSSTKGPILPWLRNIDGFNTHDDAFRLAVAGGVTSVQVLAGSANNLGGQASIIKLRRTSEGSAISMVVEPPYNLNGSFEGAERWRHLQQACGETPSEYGLNRPDAIFSLRSAYAEAQKMMNLQDVYCSNVEAGLWDPLESFPEDARLEMLVDVLRGKVKVTSQCETIVDIDALVRLTNEFKFPIASLQHASEAWLVPGLLNRTWGGSPSVALFATNHRYNQGSYRASEFAPRVLSDAGIPVALKSAHPVLNSRYLLQEAQQAHYYGLDPFLALHAVTSVPATAIGMDHRIGSLREGADADVVLWDSNPLWPGATPKFVWIDGLLQEHFHVGAGKEGKEWGRFPQVPDWDKEREQAIEWEGLPPLEGRKQNGRVLFSNVRDMSHGSRVNVAVENGRIVCVGGTAFCPTASFSADQEVDLNGGSISPGMMTFGSSLGLEEIGSEPSTGDGLPFNAFTGIVPEILNDPGALTQAVDGLVFGTRHALMAYRSGVTTGTTIMPTFVGDTNVIAGISTTFHTGASHAMEKGAIIQPTVALHVTIHRPLAKSQLSVSSQIAGLRRLLTRRSETDTGKWFKRAAEGVVPLVVDVNSADIMSTLLILKAETENELGSRIRMVFSGAAEAHILAKDIARANVGVILDAKPTVGVWDVRRSLPGPPLTNDTTLVALLREGAKVGLRTSEPQLVSNLRVDLAWAMSASNGRIGEDEAMALVSTNLRELLGVIVDDQDLVAYVGGNWFDSCKVAAIISPQRGQVEIFQ
ncbi:carbohydrate esterase family 9 protein [Roridomyces roridus]|uniref:Carbohydrate esterase family 9 protein n=1 Tax=Roridomyces roridus TaxID=1738132 RepID=A0AAD7C4L1_9AGAR|nr:carbohydrate esterase family 9 protein [Roridomyces roridus]